MGHGRGPHRQAETPEHSEGMETKANYVLIGAFTLAGFLGILGAFLWFAQVKLDKQFTYYDVRFGSVSGLGRASDVRFSGLPVGQVVDVGLSPDGDGTVLVRLEVAGGTPVRADSVATIESQGVTGVSFVGISAGTPSEPLLTAEDGIPEITAGRSVLQTLSEDAPEIVSEVLQVTQQLGELLNKENVDKVQSILDNLETSSSKLGQSLDDFAAVASTVADVSVEIGAFTTKLQPTIEGVNETLGVVDATLEGITRLAARAEETLDKGDAALVSGKQALDSAELFLSNDVPAITSELTKTTEALRQQIETLGSETQAMIAEFSTAGAAATERLSETEATIAATDSMIARLVETLDAVRVAADDFYTLTSGDGTALVAETRAMVASASEAVASIGTIAETDLPAIVADIREATETANRVIGEVGDNLSAATGRIDGLSESAQTAITQVTETFGKANETLAAINTALETGERTLEAAERAFTGADRVINEDIDAITSDLRATIERLDGALAQVSEDLPGITADLREAAAAATDAFAEFQRVVTNSGGAVSDFAERGLPQYTQLARETRALIANLEGLTRQIQRDPTRFFLGRQTPEFQR